MSLFAIVYRAGPNWKAGLPMSQQGLREHFLYLQALNKERVVVVAGPFGTDGGLVILRATDRSAATQLLEADPAVKAGVFIGEVNAFQPRIGGSEPLIEPAPLTSSGPD